MAYALSIIPLLMFSMRGRHNVGSWIDTFLVFPYNLLKNEAKPDAMVSGLMAPRPHRFPDESDLRRA
jgi:hypothetical protein